MQAITVIYHQEPDGWWAQSPDEPSFFAAGATRDEVQSQVRDTLPAVVGDVIDEYREVELSAAPTVVAADRSGEWSWLGETTLPWPSVATSATGTS